MPGAECDIEAGLVNQTISLWENELERIEKENCCMITTIITNTISSFVDVKATFSHRQFSAEKPIVVNVHVWYVSIIPNYCIKFNMNVFNQYLFSNDLMTIHFDKDLNVLNNIIASYLLCNEFVFTSTC